VNTPLVNADVSIAYLDAAHYPVAYSKEGEGGCPKPVTQIFLNVFITFQNVFVHNHTTIMKH